MAFNKSIPSTVTTASLILFLAAACSTHPPGAPETEKTGATSAEITKQKESSSVSSPPQRTEPAERKVEPIKNSSSDSSAGETQRNNDIVEIDWVRETTLDEMLSMAKSGEIQQIEWHVMPNIIRAQASDNRIFHIRNENKGIDIRNALINAGIPTGKGGINFRHVF